MIPKRIHYFWFGGKPKPESVLFCIESWKKYCPDYEITEWNESNYDYTKHQYMLRAYEEKKWAFVTDYARLDVIYQYGGIYFDTDVELINSLDEIIKNHAFMGFDKTDKAEHYVATGLGFGAEAGDCIIKEMMECYSELIQKENNQVKYVVCPVLNTECLRKHGLKNEDCDQIIENIKIYASDVFCPKSYTSFKLYLTDRTISIHHFDATWLGDHEKRLHDARAKMIIFLGARMGNRMGDLMDSIDYLFRAIKKRMQLFLG